jgi:hypothetical protein
MSNLDSSISGWTSGTVSAGDTAVSGWARSYVDGQDHSAANIIATLDDATGDEVAHSVNYTVNKAAGNDTGLLISMTDTVSNGTSLPLDIQVGGSSVMSVDAAGQQTLTHAGVGDFPSLSLYKYSSGAGYEPKLKFHKSASNTVGGNTTLSTGHDQGSIEFWGNDGNGHHESAKIYSESGGTSNNNVPGDLRFATNAGGTATTDRVVIGSAGETTFSYPVIVTAPAAPDIPLSITGAAAQAGNYVNITSNGGVAGDVFKIDAAGDVTASNVIAALFGSTASTATLTGLDASTTSPVIRIGGGRYLGVNTTAGTVTFNGAGLGFGANGQSTTYTSAFYEVSAGVIGVYSDNGITLGQLNAGSVSVSKSIYQATEVTSLPVGTTQTITLADNNHQTLDLTSSTGDATVTLTVPSGSSAGTLIIEQHATTSRDITWAVSAGAFKWMGTEPTWSSDAVSAIRIVTWRYDGAVMYLAATDVAA